MQSLISFIVLTRCRSGRRQTATYTRSMTSCRCACRLRPSTTSARFFVCCKKSHGGPTTSSRYRTIQSATSSLCSASLRERPDEMVSEQLEGTFGLGFKEYLLFFGALEPKKNVGRLIEGYLS